MTEENLFEEATETVIQGAFWLFTRYGESWGSPQSKNESTQHKGGIFDTSRAVWGLCNSYLLLPEEVDGNGKYENLKKEDLQKLLLTEIEWLIEQGNVDPYFRVTGKTNTKYWISSDINSMEIVRTTNSVLLAFFRFREILLFQRKYFEKFGEEDIYGILANVNREIDAGINWIKLSQTKASDVVTIKEGDLDYHAIYIKGSWSNVPRHIFSGIEEDAYRKQYFEGIKKNIGNEGENIFQYLENDCQLGHLQATSDSIISLALNGDGSDEIKNAINYISLEQKKSGFWDAIVCTNLFIVLGLIIGVSKTNIDLKDLNLDENSLLNEPVKKIEGNKETYWIKLNEKDSLDICILSSLVLCKKHLKEDPIEILNNYLGRIKQIGGKDTNEMIRWWPANKKEGEAAVSKTAWAISSISSLVESAVGITFSGEREKAEFEDQLEYHPIKEVERVEKSDDEKLPGIKIGLSGPSIDVVDWARYIVEKYRNRK